MGPEYASKCASLTDQVVLSQVVYSEVVNPIKPFGSGRRICSVCFSLLGKHCSCPVFAERAAPSLHRSPPLATGICLWLFYYRSHAISDLYSWARTRLRYQRVLPSGEGAKTKSPGRARSGEAVWWKVHQGPKPGPFAVRWRFGRVPMRRAGSSGNASHPRNEWISLSR